MIRPINIIDLNIIIIIILLVQNGTPCVLHLLCWRTFLFCISIHSAVFWVPCHFRERWKEEAESFEFFPERLVSVTRRHLQRFCTLVIFIKLTPANYNTVTATFKWRKQDK